MLVVTLVIYRFNIRVVKDWMDAQLPRRENPTKNDEVARLAAKSVAAGVAGAILTNPLDVLRNEMFKTDLGAIDCLRKLVREEGASFLVRGAGKNIVAVAIPIATTIFVIDILVGMKKSQCPSPSRQDDERRGHILR
jgi:hypothetical protein